MLPSILRKLDEDQSIQIEKTILEMQQESDEEIEDVSEKSVPTS